MLHQNEGVNLEEDTRCKKPESQLRGWTWEAPDDGEGRSWEKRWEPMVDSSQSRLEQVRRLWERCFMRMKRLEKLMYRIFSRDNFHNWQKSLGLNYETQTMTQTKTKITILMKTKSTER